MSVLEWFTDRKKSEGISPTDKLDIPGGLWVKCNKCATILYNKDLEANHKICPNCSYHFRLTSQERLAQTIDEGSFQEFDQNLQAVDILNFSDTKKYTERLKEQKLKSGLNDAMVSGLAKIEGYPLVLSIMDFSFLGGSMGSVVGEKFTRAAERAIQEKLPLVVFTASGGARMQEGIISLMQMAKTSAILNKLGAAQLPYIVVFTDPTTGGTTASFAMLGDVHIAEQGALIAFAGPRVIEQTIRQKLPKGFQRAEYLEEHGFVDLVLPRPEIKIYLARLLKLFHKKSKTKVTK